LHSFIVRLLEVLAKAFLLKLVNSIFVLSSNRLKSLSSSFLIKKLLKAALKLSSSPSNFVTC
jgi:hypothetical protein